MLLTSAKKIFHSSFLLFFLVTSVQVAGQAVIDKPGRLTGVIRDESNQPLAGVSVTIENSNKGTITSVSGDYVLTLSPGTYTLLISTVGFEPKRVTDIVIKSNEQTDFSISLVAGKSQQLAGVTLTTSARRESARGLLQIQKNNISMTDGISSEQMRRLPDANTAQVLRRVSGVTIQNEKFVTVRGLSDRYNNVQINGSSLPSTEPNRRNFSFDIIPSALVDNVIVNKTASPDLPGEFSGGMVQINTKDVPTKNFFEIVIGTGINTASLNNQLLTFKRDKQANFGKADDNRYWFGRGRPFDQETYLNYIINNNTEAKKKVALQIPFRWQTYSYDYQPVQNYQLSAGLNKRFDKGNSVGVIAALTYRNDQSIEEGESRTIQNYDATSIRYKYNTAISGMINMAYKTKKNKIAWKNLYSTRYGNQVDNLEGNFTSFGNDGQRKVDVTLVSKILQTKLEGEHVLSAQNLKLDWFADDIQFDREQPDTRYFTGFITYDSVLKVNRSSYDFASPQLAYGGLYSAELNESRNNAGLNLSVPFKFNKEGDKQLFKTGYIYSKRDAYFGGTYLRVKDGLNNFGSQQIGLPYYDIVNFESINNKQIIYEATGARSAGSTGDQYSGTQRFHAGYLMADLKLLKNFRLTGGARYEDNTMEVKTIFYEQVLSPPALKVVDTTKVYVERDWLPSFNLIYSINQKTNIRAAFSKTVARPDFVERSPYLYYDFAEQTEVVGEESVEITRIKNYDLRFEYYPSGGEILSASLFYKKFDKPVERFFIVGNPSNTIQYKNLYSATAAGFEIDFRKSLEFLQPSSPVLKKMMLSGNFTFLAGEISFLVLKVPGTNRDTFYVANDNRPIQGLSPYIMNGGLSYQDSSWGLNLAFNRSGRKIVNGGIQSTIVQYENPRTVLDFQANAKLYKGKMELRFNISDFLNQPYIIYSNNIKLDASGASTEGPNNDPKGDAFNEALDFTNYKVKKGINFSFNIIYKF